MRNFLKTIVVLVVSGLFFASCAKKEVFRVDISKSRETVIEREMEMKVSVTVNMPVSETEMGQAKIETINNLKSTAENILDLKDPQKPGFFESSEKITEAKYHISQKRDDGDEMSITMSYKNGKISVADKKDDPEGRFEASARQALAAMVEQSDLKALIEVGEQGEIRNIVADASLKKSLEINFEKSSGIFGVTFPEKAVKVGDSWQEKRMISDVEGVDVSSNPIELVIYSARQEDEKLNGKDVAVFKSSYKIDKKDVSGVFGGFPTTVDVNDSGNTVIYFDRDSKTFVKTIVDTTTKIVTSKSQENEKSDLPVSIDIENNSHSAVIEKVN